MLNKNTGGFGNGKRAVLVFVLLISIFAAAFGVYKVSNIILEKILPEGTASGGRNSVNVQADSSSAGSSSNASFNASSSGSEDILSAYYGIASIRLKRMTLREKAGQIFIFKCPDSDAVKSVKNYQPCGYFFSDDNFKGKDTKAVKEMLKSYQDACKVRMALCCDEEGGTVVRISCFRQLSGEKFKSPQDIYRSGGMEAVKNDTVKKARLLQSLGINMNLAPVCDVSTDRSDFIYARSFGQDAENTAEFVRVSVKAYGSENMSCVLKHFPGYGSNGDTHNAVVYDCRSYGTFQKSDFIPFKAGINAGAPCVMVSHNIVKSMDAEHPASLSPKVHSVLRQKLGFTGIIMTDDLSMGAVTKYDGGKNPCVEAFKAGNDIILTGGSMEESFDAIYSAVKSGRISKERLNESVKRILAWKYKMGIII